MFKGKRPNISHLKPFGCKCFVHNNGKNNLGKFDARSDEGKFVGYSMHSKAYRIFNKRSRTVEESIHVIFDESNDGALSDSIVHSLNLNKHDDDEEEAEKQQSPTIEQQQETHNSSSPQDEEEPTSEDDLPPNKSQQEVNQKHFKHKSSHQWTTS